MEKQDPTQELWRRLAASDPAEVSRRALVEYDPQQQAYLVPVLNAQLRVLPREKRAEGAPWAAAWEPTLLCVQYLLTAQDAPPAGQWVDPKSLPYGDFFFRGPHPVPTAGIEEAFGTRLGAFRAAAEALGGRPADMGDAAFEFGFLPRVSAVVILWAADDEFPARAKFLLDKFAHRQLPLDALWVLCRVLAKRLMAPVESPAG